MAEVLDKYGWLRCDCSETRLCKRTQVNGEAYCCRQCPTCGKQVYRLTRSEVQALTATSSLPEFDPNLTSLWLSRARQLQEAERRAEREARNCDFWRKYEEHMASAAWQALRAKVLQRADGQCEGCRAPWPSHVHHLTYARLGDEMLYDLVALCEGCHAKLHPSRRSGAAEEGAE